MKSGQTGDGVPDFSGLILAIAAQSDRAAFAALFGHFAPRVKAYLMRSGLSPLAAEEIAQETLLMVWRKAASYDPQKAAASTWIFTIARNLRIDAFRRERKAQNLAPDPSDIPDDSLAADEIHSLMERDQLLRDAMERLPREQALVIRLSYFGEKAHAEIAQELAIPLGTVKSRLRLALANLRRQLDDL